MTASSDASAHREGTARHFSSFFPTHFYQLSLQLQDINSAPIVMRFATLLVAAFAGLAAAAPVIEKRNNTSSSNSTASAGLTDAQILNYALTLEVRRPYSAID